MYGVNGMAMIKKSITVTDQQDLWIKSQIEMGFYGNESEVFRELIRERQLRERASTQALEAVREKLEHAEQNGFCEQSPSEILQDIKNGFGKHAHQDQQ